MTTRKELDAFHDLCRNLALLYPHGLPKSVKRMVDSRYAALFEGASGEDLENREVTVTDADDRVLKAWRREDEALARAESGVTYFLDTTRDREGNDMWLMTICKGDEIVDEADFYSQEAADTWLEARYPEAEKA